MDQQILNFIRSTRTQTGLSVTAQLDRRYYPTGTEPTPENNELCGLPRWASIDGVTGDPAAIHVTLLPVPARSTTGGLSIRGQPESLMKKIVRKTPRLRLDVTSYRELQRQVLERDGWRCQVCGNMQNLQIHHLRFRSQSGGDVEQNLITLCAECHKQTHRSSSRLLKNL